MDREEALSNMQAAFDLYEAAEAMMRTKLRQEYPSETASEIEGRLLEWLRERPSSPRSLLKNPQSGTIR